MYIRGAFNSSPDFLILRWFDRNTEKNLKFYKEITLQCLKQYVK